MMDYRIIHDLSLDMPTAADLDELAHLCDTDVTTIIRWAVWQFVGRHKANVLITAREAQKILNRKAEAQDVMKFGRKSQDSA